MKDIMIATSNKGKVREYKSLLEPLGYIVHDLSELDPIEIDENGSTFQENALIKAKSIKGNPFDCPEFWFVMMLIFINVLVILYLASYM